MKHISIVVPVGAALSGIEVSRHVFTEVNDYLKSQGKRPAFHIQLVGATDTVTLNNGLFSIQTDVTVADLQKTDLIVIPGLHVDLEQNVNKNTELVEWITAQYRQGAEVASLCVGAFLLAKTGLLQGRKCTTHWKAASVFRNLYPDVNLVKDKIITDEYGIYSSGGGFSFMNLLIYLVGKYVGRDTAIYCAKFFQVDIDRSAQLPFIVFQMQKDHNDDSVRKAQEFIEHNFHQKITVDDLADRLALGRRSLERRFKKATSNTPNEYLQRVRVEAAKKQLESSNRKINDIMEAVGYSDTKAFRQSFRSITGLLPKEYRNKYNPRVMEF